MIAIRAAKAATVAAIALFATLVVFGNLTDYNTNFAFVEHVMSMGTIFPFSTIKYRAITNPALWHAAYALIIATQAATALLCWVGAAALARALRADAATFNRAQKLRRPRPYARVSAVAGRIHVDRRGMVRHVAVAAMERPAECLPIRYHHHRRADLRGDAGSRSRTRRDVRATAPTAVGTDPSTVIAGLDPEIHPLRMKGFF